MALYDSATFYNGRGPGWQDVTIAGGPILVCPHHKKMYGSGNLIDQLGFWRSGGIVTAANYIFQIDFWVDSAATGVISLCGLSLNTGLNSNTSVNIMFNTFLGSEIRLNDYGQNEVSGGTGVSTLAFGGKYTAKLLINANGTVTGYVDTPTTKNHDLGTTTSASDLVTDTVYFSTNQTFISPESKSTNWDNYAVHDEGLGYTLPPNPVGANLDSYDWDMKERYMDE